MSINRGFAILSVAAVLLVGVACETTITTTLPSGAASSGLRAPDGIDAENPNIERSSLWIDFDGIKTVRIEIPMGRVSVTQSNGSTGAMLRVTEFILVEGLSYEVLTQMHTHSAVSAERSFVDDSRLDIKASLADGLAETDVVFDVRVVIPEGANVEVLLSDGPVEVMDVTGNVEIRTANGEVSLNHVEGNVVALTSNRPISAIDVTGNVRAETSDAGITLRLAPPPDGKVTAKTTDGTIQLTIANTTAATVELTAIEGVVTANLSGFEVTDISTGSGFLSGVLNQGGGEIEAYCERGEIVFGGM